MTLDTQILFALNSLVDRSPNLDFLIRFAGDYLAYIAGAAFIVIVFFLSYPLRKRIEIILVGLVAGFFARGVVDEAVRLFWHRLRPYEAFPGQIHTLYTDSSWSFPSGHASFFFALSTALYMYDRKLGLWFYAVSVIITVGRVAAGVHFPSDIVGGAVLGALTGYLTVRFARWIIAKNVTATY